MIERVNIIGEGNVGSRLRDMLGDKVLSTSNSRDLSISGLSPGADLNIICVPDDQIENVASQLSKEIPAVHTSGAVSIDALGDIKSKGILYPLQTFTKDRPIDLKTVPFLLEASSSEFLEDLETFCKSNLSERIHHVDSSKRAVIHLAAVFANNFSTQMLVEASEILQEANIDISIFDSLMKETVSKAMDLGPRNALTGPAKRGDIQVMEKHLDELEDEDLKKLYQLISKRISD